MKAFMGHSFFLYCERKVARENSKSGNPRRSGLATGISGFLALAAVAQNSLFSSGQLSENPRRHSDPRHCARILSRTRTVAGLQRPIRPCPELPRFTASSVPEPKDEKVYQLHEVEPGNRYA
jgi:hypothetical protein